MSVSAAEIAFALELFQGLGPLTHRKMMGGLCLYRSGVIFALLHSDGSVWLKGAGGFAATMTAEGWERWTYARPGGKPVAMPYWRLPDAALDDPDLACNLAAQALNDLG
ncbi:TfoX/Sxy family protein [Albidovulum sediminicola]|uniref:TfoX/Sxy family protein n=1 Tax=Albidovulum sediminicola TaxID=2984331 RepID=A0ABT2YY77_9RHOB|nr:TfoX/Sxy family protein [Defluviimonas sp. WL0075]MCV2863834.1 TfoX/Sxy family protein [Defluviimonas sp. WL0075]